MFERQKRDQPRIRAVFGWNGESVVETAHCFYRLDVERSRAHVIASPGDREILGLAGVRGTAVALTRDRRGHQLFTLGGPHGSRMTNVLTRGFPSERARLVGGDTHLVIAVTGALEWYAGERSGETPCADMTVDDSTKMVIHRGRLYIGTNRGEFGGGLRAIEIESGRTEELALPGPSPVTGIAVDPSGTLWVTKGIAHLGMRDGALHRLGDDGWERVASCGRRAEGDWPYEPSSFDAISFSPRGEPVLLCSSLGLVRLSEGRWVRDTPTWPAHVYVQALHVTKDGTAIIGTFDAGVEVLTKAQVSTTISLGWTFR